MGRGRQKAKQTKVARALKYTSPETDYRALEQELRGDGSVATNTWSDDDGDDTGGDDTPLLQAGRP